MNRPLVTLDEFVDPRHAALLVIDVQKDYCLARLWGREVPAVQAMMPRLLRFMDVARRASVTLIHLHNSHPDETNSPAWVGRKWTDKGPTPEYARPGTEGIEFMPGFEPRPGEFVVGKNRYSGFIATNLELILRSLGKQTIICTGTATNNCVESTARHGYMLDFNLVLVSDGTASYDPALHEGTLTNIRNHFGKVATVDEIIACWRKAGHLPEREYEKAPGILAGG